ncbi:DNA-directed RNA polymerase III-like protein [Phialemonium atrogriseum]|uniref:DNA-directed RNA polymerase III-like protein n=1 Tax=Phialemonium atrogriseum TaxID=1093897 RepID=A0AAJ0BUZ4_9PEZI|nr:DNA-directed RNA polymerase III-like protein [Phialemonium atrogriseum]KAK1764746.1 DNA-directed RNA polymerase III-like protein [Phialemonium atrogriseum]
MAGLASPAVDGDDAAKLAVLKETLYDEMQQHGSNERLYNQKDLIDLNIIPNDDIILLLRVVQRLCDDYLLVSTNDGRSGLAWRWRSKEDARKYRALPNNEAVMVYTLIDEASSDGIWSRTLKAKLKMHESVLKQCIKHLESKGYITDMKSVEHPNKKMYIRADLRPSERATGGAWYTDNNLDEAFITELEVVVFNFVKLKSAHFREGSRAPRKGVVKGEPGAGPKGKKRAATEISDEAGGGGPSANGTHAAGTSASAPTTPAAGTPAPAPTRQAQHHPRKDAFQPYPAGYMRYPTIREIAQFISDMQITNNTTLSESDVQQLVDVLVFDGLLEPILVGRRQGYRATRIARQDPVARPGQGPRPGDDGAADVPPRPALGIEPLSNALVEAPCGRCPVFDLCEEGGPVNPTNCVYFQRWLGLD